MSQLPWDCQGFLLIEIRNFRNSSLGYNVAQVLLSGPSSIPDSPLFKRKNNSSNNKISLPGWVSWALQTLKNDTKLCVGLAFISSEESVTPTPNLRKYQFFIAVAIYRVKCQNSITQNS